MCSTTALLPDSKKASSPVASYCRMRDPNSNPCVHSVHPRVVYFPPIVNTGDPSDLSYELVMDFSFAPDRAQNFSIFGRRSSGVIFEFISICEHRITDSRQHSFPGHVELTSQGAYMCASQEFCNPIRSPGHFKNRNTDQQTPFTERRAGSTAILSILPH